MLKKLFYKFRREIFLGILIVAGFLALLSRLNNVGLGLILGGVAVYFFMSYKHYNPGKIKRLEQELENSRREIEQLRQKRFQLAGMRPILEVGLMEIDTHFTRTWNEKHTEDKRELHFIGALQVKLKAKYGVNLKDLSVRMDHDNKIIQIAGFKPRFLSFSDINHEWKIAEMLEYKKRPWILDNYWKKSEQYQSLLHRMMEEKRKAVYEEIKQGPEEVRWMVEPLYQQVENTLRILLQRSDYDVSFVDKGGRDFLPLEQFTGLSPSLSSASSLPEKQRIPQDRESKNNAGT